MAYSVYVLLILGAAVFTEGFTELCLKSAIFSSLRDELRDKSSFLDSLLSCGFCFSMWAACIPSLFFTLFFFYINAYFVIPQFLITVIVVQRLSNYLHNFNDKFLDKYYDPRFKV